MWVAAQRSHEAPAKPAAHWQTHEPRVPDTLAARPLQSAATVQRARHVGYPVAPDAQRLHVAPAKRLLHVHEHPAFTLPATVAALPLQSAALVQER